ncbi:hypothetical protein BH09BAC3_BH09BAC3_32520 [soil metagenome]
MKVQLRPYDTQDTPALLDLFRETIHTVNSIDYRAEIIVALAPPYPDIKKKQAKFKNSKTVVAHLDGKIVGFANLDNDLSSIGMLYVHKDYLNQHIGSRLLKSLEKKLSKKEIAKAVADVSITGKAFFEKRGYNVVKENKKMLNGIEFLTYSMEKNLTSKENTMAKEMKEKDDAKEKIKGPRPFNWRNLFINKFFDLLMVIIGVSAAFQLENLREQADHKSTEIFYLESMLGDLRKDREKMMYNLQSLKEDQGLLENFLAKMNDQTYAADSLGPVLVKIMNLETMRFNQNTYEMLESSGGLTEFSDRGIRTQTTDYYNRYASIERFEQIYTTVIFNLNSHFGPYLDLSLKKIVDPSIIPKYETKNWLLLSNSQLSTGIEDYTEALEKGELLIKSIENRLLKGN